MNKFFNFMLSGYENDDLEIKKRAKNLLVIVLILFLAIILLILSSLINKNYRAINTVIYTGIILFLVSSLILLQKKKYKISSNIMIVFLFFCVNSFKYISEPTIATYEIASLSFYVLVIMLITLLLAYKRYQIIMSILLAQFSLLIIYFIRARSLPAIEGESSSLSALISSMVLIGLGGVSGLFLKKIFDDILKVVDEKSNRNLTWLNELSKVIITTKDNIEIGEDLIRMAGNSSTALEEMGNSLAANKENLNRLKEELQESVTALNQMTNSIDSITNQIGNQNETITSSSAVIKDMLDSIQITSSLVEDVKKTSDVLTVTARDGLEKKDQAIESVAQIALYIENVFGTIEIIDDVASKVNLLSMNAAIEAAHVGSSGKGFAVVAEEMRKLADEAMVNSKAISNSLKKMVNDIKFSIEFNKRSGSTFNDLVDGIMNIVKAIDIIGKNVNILLNKSNTITTSVNTLVEVSQSVEADTREVETGINSINSRMLHISNLSTESYHNIQEIKVNADHMLNATTELLDIGKQNKQNILELNDKLHQFDREKE